VLNGPFVTDLTTLDEPEVVDLARGGRQDAWREIVRRTGEKGFHRTVRRLRDPDDARDVVAITYERVWKHLLTLKPGSGISGYFFTVLGSVTVDFIRARKPRTKPEDLRRAEEAALAEGSSPDEALSREATEEENAVRARDLLSRLEDADRQVADLFYREKKTYREIGETLGYEEREIRNVLVRVRRTLRGELKKAA